VREYIFLLHKSCYCPNIQEAQVFQGNLFFELQYKTDSKSQPYSGDSAWILFIQFGLWIIIDIPHLSSCVKLSLFPLFPQNSKQNKQPKT
jgi:hypothetical protein